MTRVEIDPEGMRELLRDPWVQRVLLDAAVPVVRRAKAGAPKLTGAGAASIHSEPHLVDGEWEVRVSWDAGHDYLRFHELGDRYMPARPFLRPAVRGPVDLGKGGR